jgi:hypothetical protein
VTIDAFEPIADAVRASGLLERAPAMTYDLFTYVEAQVHGVLTFDDVEAVVIDPSYVGTPTGDALLAAAERYGCAAEWHEGHRVTVADIPDDHLWREHVDVRALGVEHLDAATLGTLRIPEAKYVWRMIAHYSGQP